VTPEQRVEAIRFRDEPLTPAEAARDEAMLALAQQFRDLAAARAATVLRLVETTPGAAAALDALWDCVAAEVARCQALDCGTLSIRQALAVHELAPAIEDRARALRTSGTN